MDDTKDMNNSGGTGAGAEDVAALEAGGSDAGERLEISSTIHQKIDSKGRFTFPKKIRDMLEDGKRGEDKKGGKRKRGGKKEEEAEGGEGPEKERSAVILTRGAQFFGYRCLWAMSRKEWNELADKIDRMPQSERKMRLNIHFLGGKEECEIDNFGRVLLSPSLREWARVETGELSIIGVGKRIVIVDKKYCNAYFSQDGYDGLIDGDVNSFGL